jgi:hypothetical protein
MLDVTVEIASWLFCWFSSLVSLLWVVLCTGHLLQIHMEKILMFEEQTDVASQSFHHGQSNNPKCSLKQSTQCTKPFTLGLAWSRSILFSEPQTLILLFIYFATHMEGALVTENDTLNEAFISSTSREDVHSDELFLLFCKHHHFNLHCCSAPTNN